VSLNVPQTSVSVQETVAYAGMVGDIGAMRDALSFVNAEASSEIAFGTMVVQGSAADECLIPSGQSDVSVGIALHSHAFQKDNELGDTGVKPDVVLSALQRGRIWVPVTEAVAVGGAVRVFMSGGNAGKFGTSASAGVTKLITSSARFLSATSGAGVALLEIDINNRSGWSNDS
jgi:hypothetical protein